MRKLIKGLLAFLLAGTAVSGLPANAASKPATKPTASKSQAKTQAKPETKQARTIELSVTDRGFEPSPVNVKANEPLKLVVTRKTDDTCATDIVIKDYGIQKALPLNQPVTIEFTPTKSGELKYGCAMGQMVGGVLLVE